MTFAQSMPAFTFAEVLLIAVASAFVVLIVSTLSRLMFPDAETLSVK